MSKLNFLYCLPWKYQLNFPREYSSKIHIGWLETNQTRCTNSLDMKIPKLGQIILWKWSSVEQLETWRLRKYVLYYSLQVLLLKKLKSSLSWFPILGCSLPCVCYRNELGTCTSFNAGSSVSCHPSLAKTSAGKPLSFLGFPELYVLHICL